MQCEKEITEKETKNSRSVQMFLKTLIQNILCSGTSLIRIPLFPGRFVLDCELFGRIRFLWKMIFGPLEIRLDHVVCGLTRCDCVLNICKAFLCKNTSFFCTKFYLSSTECIFFPYFSSQCIFLCRNDNINFN